MDNILNKVNRVATLRAQIAEMAKEEKELIAEMKDFGTGVYQGTEHQIVISESTRKLLISLEGIIIRRISRSRDVLGRVRRYVHAIRVRTRRWVIIP